MGFLTRKGLYDSGRVLFLPVEDIAPNPGQPRTQFSQPELEELAGSIRALGLLQPLTVRRGEHGWELVAGERRLRAFQALGREEIPAILAEMDGLRQVPCLSVQADGQTSSLFALVENLQRRDLDFWEEALALRRLQEDFALSQEELARRLGKSQSAIANKLRLLKLPQEVLSSLRDAGCTERHARALLRLPDGEAQRRTADRVIRDKLTVAQTEALVESMLRAPPPKKRHPVLIVKDVRLFLNTISHSLDVMRSAGVDAQCQRQDDQDAITLTIRIPTPPRP